MIISVSAVPKLISAVLVLPIFDTTSCLKSHSIGWKKYEIEGSVQPENKLVSHFGNKQSTFPFWEFFFGNCMVRPFFSLRSINAKEQATKMRLTKIGNIPHIKVEQKTCAIVHEMPIDLIPTRQWKHYAMPAIDNVKVFYC